MPFAALEKITKTYTLAKHAGKEKDYICLECGEDLILKKGEKIAHHFAHYSTNKTCTSGNGESEKHWEAKYLLKYLLENNYTININKTNSCKECHQMNNNVAIIKMNRDQKIEVEYRGFSASKDNNNKKLYIADLALIENEKIKYIFEIKHTHKVEESKEFHGRPEPWYEFEAEQILTVYKDNKNIELDCIRIRKDKLCQKCFLTNNYYPIKILRWKYGAEKNFKQSIACLSCSETNYMPIFNLEKRRYYALCRMCDKSTFFRSICHSCGYLKHEKCTQEYDINKYPILSNLKYFN